MKADMLMALLSAVWVSLLRELVVKAVDDQDNDYDEFILMLLDNLFRKEA